MWFLHFKTKLDHLRKIKLLDKIIDFALPRLAPVLRNFSYFRVSDMSERFVIYDLEYEWKNSSNYGILAHIQRYRWASSLASGLCLDDGCGSGFGSYYLSSFVSDVVCMDISCEAISWAKKHYEKSNIQFAVSDGMSLPFKDKIFDTCISFHVLEHVRSPYCLISEIARVLKPEGLLILGTPNASLSKKSAYHFIEFTVNELERLLSLYFTSIKIMGQDMVINGQRQKENWLKYEYRLSKNNLIIVEDDVEYASGLLAVCSHLKKNTETK